MLYPYRVPDELRVGIPERSLLALESFVNVGGMSSLNSCLFHLLAGDAFYAACVADRENRDALGAMLVLIARHFPTGCYGSSEAVAAWRGLKEDLTSA